MQTLGFYPYTTLSANQSSNKVANLFHYDKLFPCPSMTNTTFVKSFIVGGWGVGEETKWRGRGEGGNKMNVKINGNLYFSDNSLNYEHLNQVINDNSYNSIGDAVISHLSDAIQNTEWYHREIPNFDLVENFNSVKSICGDDKACYWDSLNWTIMNKTEVTKDIYKFISHRTSIVKEGFRTNFLPDHIDFHALLDMIDWHFVLDCISFLG